MVENFYEQAVAVIGLLNLKVEDHIVLIRLLLGCIYGFTAYLLFRLNLKLPGLNVDLTIWMLAGFIYVASAFIIKRLLGVSSLFQLYVRGLLTFYGSWLIVFLIMYDVFS